MMHRKSLHRLSALIHTMLGAVKALVTGRPPPENFNESIRVAGEILRKNNAARSRLQAEAFAITGEWMEIERQSFIF